MASVTVSAREGVFLIELGIVLIWAATRPLFHYPEGWQILINTRTTIITFPTTFLLQSSHACDSRAIHLELNELLFAAGAARNANVVVGNLPDSEFDQPRSEFAVLAGKQQEGGRGETTWCN